MNDKDIKSTVKPVEKNTKLNVDHLNLRMHIGILGVALPLLLIIGNRFIIEDSISRYYYTDMIVFFTGVLFAFALVLLAYKGYPLEKGERISDNFITNIAGALAFIVAIVPTRGEDIHRGVPNWHDSDVLNYVHLTSAGIFIFLMGYMALKQFPKEKKKLDNSEMKPQERESIKRRVWVYKLCGSIVWLSLVFLVISAVFGPIFGASDIFWGETVALVFFGIAWLTKSKSLARMGL